MPRRYAGALLGAPAALIACATPGYAAVYLTVQQAQQAIFPGEVFVANPITLTVRQRVQIEDRSGMRVRNAEVAVWKASGGGWLIEDEVLGKHEFITYAVGLTADGTVKQIEIMEYRESYGYEIREPAWRAQFAGKGPANQVTLGRDIENISGATLSCRHITDGVRRVLALYELVLR